MSKVTDIVILCSLDEDVVGGGVWQHPATVQLLIQQEHERGFKRILLEEKV